MVDRAELAGTEVERVISEANLHSWKVFQNNLPTPMQCLVLSLRKDLFNLNLVSHRAQQFEDFKREQINHLIQSGLSGR